MGARMSVSFATLKRGVSRVVLDAASGLSAVRRTAHLMCGIADYDTYVAHRRARHPDAPMLSYAAFMRDREAARYGRNAAHCC
jgi:uncharacterized short protein YbdD (DUF466 family)